MNRCGRYAVMVALAMIPAVAIAIDVPRRAPRAPVTMPVAPILVPIVPPVAPAPPIVWPAPLPSDGAGPTIIGNPGEFFGPDSYPPAAIRAEEQGRTVARVLVDARGNPQACEVEVSSGSESLDTVTCRIAQVRLRFVPAHDALGKPLASTFLLPVRWVLPEPEPTPRISFSRVTRAELSASGTVISCATSATGRSSGSFEGDFCVEMRGDRAANNRVIAAIGGKRAILWMQLAVTFDGDKPFGEEHKHGDRTVVGLGRYHFSIAGDGTVTACDAVERSGIFGSAPICDIRFDKYAPVATAEKGGATVLFSFSTAPAPVARPVRKGTRPARRSAHRAR